MSYHAHFDCFSGAAGDMMLAACLDAADSLKTPSTENTPASEELLAQITSNIENGMPELRGEFSLSIKRVWRSMGMIAAKKVDVMSVYNHEAAPVPVDNEKLEREHSHEHHHSHEHGHRHEHSHHHNHDSETVHSHPEHFHDEANGSTAQDVVRDHSIKHDHFHNHNHNSEKKQSVHSHEHSHAKMQNTAESKESSHDHNHQHHSDDDSHSHSHGHSHSHSHNHSKLRNLSQITKMLREADPTHIPPIVSSLAISSFTELAHAEMYTHGASSLDAVHFHEVGAVDSIVDTVGTLLALHSLGVDLGDETKECAVTCSRLPLGEGTVWTDHGLLPVPAPATMRLIVGMPTCPGPKGVTGELVTPTAAALLRVLTGVYLLKNEEGKSSRCAKESVGRPPNLTPRAIGVGAGTKDFQKHANILRLILGDEVSNQKENVGGSSLESHFDNTENEDAHDSITAHEKWDINMLTHLEANIDDATPELLGHAIDLLLQNGAIDAWVNPIVMKKGRPAHTLNCICRSDVCSTNGSNETAENQLLGIIFRHTTTLGIRIQRNILRAALKRRFMEIQLPYRQNSLDGKVNVKISSFKDGEVTSVKAEFDQCKIVSVESGIPLKSVTSAAEKMAWDKL